MSNQTAIVVEGTQSAQPNAEYLTFKVGSEDYGVDIRQVQELRGYDLVMRVANAKDYVKGVINLRGLIVPIIDLRIKLDSSVPTYNQFTVVIVLHIDSHVVGAVVDSVSEVVAFAADQIKGAPDLGSALQSNYILGIGTVGEHMVTLVDIEQLLIDTDLNLITRVAA